MNDRHEQNRAVAQRYVELYNADPERFVHECYHPDYKATAMGSGSFEGVDTFIEVEKSVLRAAPRRRMEGVVCQNCAEPETATNLGIPRPPSSSP